MNRLLDQARDKRTLSDLERNIIRGNVIGKMALRGLAVNLMINRLETPQEITWEYFDEEMIDESQEKFEASPDANLYVYGDPIQLEIKCYVFGKPETVFIRPVKMFRTIRDGWLYISAPRQWAAIPFTEIGKYPLKETPEFGGKKTFHIPSSSLDWQEHGSDVFDGWKRSTAEAYRNS